MKFRFLLLAVTACALAGCGLSDQQKADYASVQRAGVSPAIYDKMMHDDPLSIGDIIALSQARISDGVVIRYIRDHGTIYVLSSQDFDRLQQGGVSRSVIDFMAHTPVSNAGGPPIPISIGIGVGGGGCWR